MKVLGVAVMAVLVIGAFTSIPNVMALSNDGTTLWRAEGNRHLEIGSKKVCGVELCGSRSIPNLTVEEKENIALQNPTNRALERALDSPVASNILAEYHAYKQVQQPVIIEEPIVESDEVPFSNFANSGFTHPQETRTTLMKTPDEKTIIEKKKEMEEYMKTQYPSYIRQSYANPDHPVYVPKVVEKPMMEDVTNSNMTNIITSQQADLILSKLGFDIDVTNIGICGPGTVNVSGICMSDEVLKTENVNIDWADYWNTKEEKEIVLDKVVMTNGTEAMPVMGDNQTTTETQVVDEPTPTAQPEPIKEVVIETMTTVPDESVVIDGKTFKNQASADRYLELKNKNQPIVVAPEPVPTVPEVPVNPRVQVDNSTDDSGFDDSGLLSFEVK